VGLLLYTLAIVSFLGGAWWGIALLRQKPAILIGSNSLVITAWAGAWLLDTSTALLLLVVLLILTARIEGWHPMFRHQPRYYRRLRPSLTGVASLAAVLASLAA